MIRTVDNISGAAQRTGPGKNGYTLVQFLSVITIIASISTVVFPLIATPPKCINLFDRYYHAGMSRTSVYCLLSRLSDEQESNGDYASAIDYFRGWSAATTHAYVSLVNPDTPDVLRVQFSKPLSKIEARTQAIYFYSCFVDVRSRFMSPSQAKTCVVFIEEGTGRMVAIGGPGKKNFRVTCSA